MIVSTAMMTASFLGAGAVIMNTLRVCSDAEAPPGSLSRQAPLLSPEKSSSSSLNDAPARLPGNSSFCLGVSAACVLVARLSLNLGGLGSPEGYESLSERS